MCFSKLLIPMCFSKPILDLYLYFSRADTSDSVGKVCLNIACPLVSDFVIFGGLHGLQSFVVIVVHCISELEGRIGFVPHPGKWIRPWIYSCV